MPEQSLRLLALDGGGIRGLSSLMILEQLMQTVNPESPPKPCDYFNMIGGTGMGGIIAIMLGRLQMTVEECIITYISLIDSIFRKKRRLNLLGKVQGRFDSAALEAAVQKIIKDQGYCSHELLRDTPYTNCKGKNTGKGVRFTSYRSPRGGRDLLDTTKIWEACRATSAAPSCFSPITIGLFREEFVGGGTGSNNPIWALWEEAQSIWGPEPIQEQIACLVSIGTGMPSLQGFGSSPLQHGRTLLAIAMETEDSAEQFRRDKTDLHQSGRYFRFNVMQGLGAIGLTEVQSVNTIAQATRVYVASQNVVEQMQRCRDGPSEMHRLRSLSKVFYHIPFLKNKRFTGRSEELAAIEQSLFVDNTCDQLALVGLGGVGKTQVVLQFAHMLKEAYPEYSVVWLPAVSLPTYEQACVEIAAKLHLGQSKGGEDAKLLLKQYLSDERAGKWLLIIDNADDHDLIFGCPSQQSPGIVNFLPKSENGLTLFTTRSQGNGVRLADSNVIELKQMLPEEAVVLFRRFLPRVQEGLSELLSELAYLPLAIVQAAAYIITNKTSVTRYLQLLRRSDQDAISLLGRGFDTNARYDNAENSIGRTWFVSFCEIQRQNQHAASILKFMACIEPKAIPRSLLPHLGCEEEMDYAINILRAYDFVTQRDGMTFDLHHLVHLAIRMWLGEDELERTERRVLGHLNRMFPSETWDNRLVWREYLPHVFKLAQAESVLDVRTRYFLLIRAARCLYLDGRLQEAISWLREAYESTSRAKGYIFRLDGESDLGGAHGRICLRLPSCRAVQHTQHHHNTPDDPTEGRCLFRRAATAPLEDILSVNVKPHKDHDNRQRVLPKQSRDADGQAVTAANVLEQNIPSTVEFLARDKLAFMVFEANSISGG
ncbi:hypothetical protein N7457_003281 [Penicillium paradoxum]|uniref:uncharacterized protein n=1 Tax=Penicillium paradoxum TaxID=176176 RepID=UPI002548B0DD|nr:uncharacterized protein N7457_003281 [Penicillium paradoxum]KAJ5788291.1 hypothetical protein N7457_003281 [Penicillium paradoxum]